MAKKKKNKPSHSNTNTKLLEKEGRKYFGEGNYLAAISTWNRLIKLRGGIKAPINKPILQNLSEAYYTHALNSELMEKQNFLIQACVYQTENWNYLLSFLELCLEQNSFSLFESLYDKLRELGCDSALFDKIAFLLSIRMGTKIDKKMENKSPFEGASKRLIDTIRLVQKKSYSRVNSYLRKFPESVETDFFIAVFLFCQGKFEDSIEKFLPITKAENEILSLFASYYLGLSFYQAGKFEQASASIRDHYNILKKYSFFLTSKRKKRISYALSCIVSMNLSDDLLEEHRKIIEQAMALDRQNKHATKILHIIFFRQALKYVQCSQLEKAIDAWEQLRSLEPDNLSVLKNLAIAYLKQKKYHQSITFWEATIALQQQKSKNHTVYRKSILENYEVLAYCYSKAERFIDCRKTYLRMLQISPQSTVIKKTLAEYYLEEYKLEEAFEFIEELMEVEPENVDHLINMGIACDLANEEKSAMAWWKKALALEPQNLVAREFLVQRYYKEASSCYYQEKNNSALAALSALFKICPLDTKALTLKGIMSYNLKNEDDAEKYFEKAIQHERIKGKANLYIGKFMLELGEMEKAEKHFQRTVEICEEKDLAELARSIGFLYTKRQEGNYEAIAAVYFDMAIEKGGYQIATEITEFLLEADSQEIEKYAKVASELNPESSTPLLFLSIYYARHRQLDKIDGLLDHAKKLDNYHKLEEMQNFVSNMMHLQEVSPSLAK